MKRKNPYSGSKHSKEEHEASFHSSHAHSIGAAIIKTSKNNKQAKTFTKESLADITSSPNSLDL